MNSVKRNATVRSRLIRIWLVAGGVVLCGPVASRAINAVTPATSAVQQGATAGQTAGAAWSSPGVADIVKLVDAKVDGTVIQSYVKNSPTAYNPSATEIIALKDHGVGPEILTAMLQRGAEARVQAMQAAQVAQGAVAQPANPGAANFYAPAYNYGAQPVYLNYAYSYPVSSYAYPSYDYGYAGGSYGYGGYGYGWPYLWPSLSFGFGCYPSGGYGGYGYTGWRGGYGCGYGYGGRSYYGGQGHYGSRGYYGAAGYYGGRGYNNTGGYYGGHGNSGSAARPVPYGGQGGGYRSVGGAGRPAAVASPAGGYRAAGGFSGQAASFGSRGGGFGGRGVSVASRGGGFGGHASGRGR